MVTKSLRLLLLVLTLMVIMTVSAVSASFTGSADALNEMGLFSGTGKGYELDRAPTRSEAAAMLVRLLGGEKEAFEQSYEIPFTDVPNWAKPYVGWLYHSGLTTGVASTTYGTSDKCTAQMYATFLLRALGYKDSGEDADFSYAKAMEFALEKGVVDYINCDADNFLRDHVVAMSYTALSVKPRDTNYDTLLDKLISSNAIEAEKASRTRSNFALYREYKALSEKQASADKIAIRTKNSLDVTVNGVVMMNTTSETDLKAKINKDQLDKSQLLMNSKVITFFPDTVGAGISFIFVDDTNSYYIDGVYYTETDAGKVKMPMSFYDLPPNMTLSAVNTTALGPISMLDSISKNSDGSYSICYSPSFMNIMINSVIASIGVTDESLSIDKFDLIATTENGQISSMKSTMVFSTVFEGEVANVVSVFETFVTATGDAVVMTLPTDLDTYPEIPWIPA